MTVQWFSWFAVLALTSANVVPQLNTTGWTDVVWDGIYALDTITDKMMEKDLEDVLHIIDSTTQPCFLGWETFFRHVMWASGDDDDVKEMKKAYGKVNDKLKQVEEYVTAVKEDIDWDVVEVEFTDMETRIRRMGKKLEEVLHDDVDQEDGRKEYVRVYEVIYKSSGLDLHDSIISNYHVYQENLLQAAIHYSTSENFEEYMKGLLAILMRAAAVEIAYEQFSDHDRSMVDIWVERMADVKNMMKEAIYDERDKLLKEYQNDVRSISTRTSTHQAFVNDAYDFLMEKYWWRYWFVMSLPYGSQSQALVYLDADSEFMYSYNDYNRRYFMVCSTEKRMNFNVTAANNDIRDRECPPSSVCSYPAKELNEEHPPHGVGKFVISSKDFVYAIRATPGRYTSGHINLKKTSMFYPFVMFYFG